MYENFTIRRDGAYVVGISLIQGKSAAEIAAVRSGVEEGKKKDQIKGEYPQIEEALTRSSGRLLFLMASMDGKSWAPE